MSVGDPTFLPCRSKVHLRAGWLTAALLLAAPAMADHYPRQPGLQVKGYEFDLTLRDDTDEISVRETVEVIFTVKGIRSIDLDLCTRAAALPDLHDPCHPPTPLQAKEATAPRTPTGMQVTAVLNGTLPLSFEHHDDRLHIRLAQASRAGEDMRLSLAYHGIPAAGLFIGKNRRGERVFFSDSWPDRARNWLATLDHISIKAPKTLRVTAPSHYAVISNGTLTGTEDLPGGLRQTTWREPVPLPSWQYSLAAADLVHEPLGTSGGVELSAWLEPQRRAEGLRVLAPLSLPVFQFYSAEIGPYAFESLAHVQATGGRGAYEFATSIFYHTGFSPLPHETAHQWFGDAVTEADWDDVWLSEGFATYFALLYTEHRQGREAFLQGVRRARNAALDYARTHPTDTIVHDNLVHPADVLLNTPQIYEGGAMVLHTLRGLLGDRLFWEGIRLYYQRYRNRSATTDDFRRAMQDACLAAGHCPSALADLSWFFQQWLRQGSTPEIRGTWHYDPARKVLQVSLAQERRRCRIPLQLGVTTASHPSQTIRLPLLVDGPMTTASFPMVAPPQAVQIDPDLWVPLMEAQLTALP